MIATGIHVTEEALDRRAGLAGATSEAGQHDDVYSIGVIDPVKMQQEVISQSDGSDTLSSIAAYAGCPGGKTWPTEFIVRARPHSLWCHHREQGRLQEAIHSKLYDRTTDEVSLVEIERIVV